MKLMNVKALVGALALVVFATGCQASTEIESSIKDLPTASIVQADETPTPQTEPTVEPTEVATPQDEPAQEEPAQEEPGATATPRPTASPIPVPSPTSLPPTSPEAPLPNRWLCTENVELTEELNLRANPSLDAPIVFGIPGGSCRIRTIGVGQPGWEHVVYETQNISIVGYVSSDFSNEIPENVVALNWVERVIAEQDTSQIGYQPMIADSIAVHPFPSAAYTVRPFDAGTSNDCELVGDVTLACRLHLFDSAGELITPMVVLLQQVGTNGYDESFFPDDFGTDRRVIGFELCTGPDVCADFDTSLHNRVVVDDSASLAGVELGLDADESIEMLTAIFGTPSEDSGWVVGCPLDGEDLVNERYVIWGSLAAGFHRADNDLADTWFDYWSYRLNLDGTTHPGGPLPAEVQLPKGTAFEMNITIAGESLEAEQFVNEVLQVQQLTSEEWALYGAGVEADTRIAAVGVPFIPVCD